MTKQFKKHFVALAAPSGGGKTTLCHMLLKNYSDTCLSISYTTRAPRGAEVEGRDYFFVTKEKFQNLIKENALAEWAEVHGNLYGTSKQFLEDRRAENKIVLFDVDIQGVVSLKKAYPEETLSFFIHPPSLIELEARLRARKTESDEKIAQRLSAAVLEISRAGECSYQMVNRSLPETFEDLRAIFERDTGAR